MSYNHHDFEIKWQKEWEKNNLFKAEDFSSKPKYYGLIEFPYPSGAGLHVGHIRAYSSIETIVRKKRMEGYNVLFPIGFDAFGLPTENYAIKTGIHPRKVTDDNIATFTKQLKRAGFSFDFSRVVDTTDPHYYKWTQWIFLKLFENGLAYRDKTYVNYCPSCKVVLANEEARGGECDRCHNQVVQKEKDVWFLKITEYADKLLEGLNDVDYLPRIKLEQENWIGKSKGAYVDFGVTGIDELLKVYTTRPDTLFGATFMVISPEHPILEKYEDKISNIEEIKVYKEKAKLKSEFERVQLAKDKTGILIDGLKGINPVNDKEIPLFVADYVMMGYGTGAIMAVPGHDTRDWEFAKKFNLPIVEVIKGGDIDKEAFTDTDTGILVNSGFLNDLSVEDAKIKITEFLENKNIGESAVQYKMKDWAFNRQRYWGEPIPIVYCDHCGMVPAKEEDLPITLPDIEHFQPSDEGESPLANAEDWVNTTCPVCGRPAKRETDTMPQWAGSSWYFLRYADPDNDKEFAARDKLDYWIPVDWYNGGMEHATRHMIYSRFWHHFLYDLGLVPTKEPYKKRTAQGMILGNDGNKMSKSMGNVVNPNDIIDEMGADTLRVYSLFIGDYEQAIPWSENGVKGSRRFLEKVWRLEEKVDVNNNKITNQLETFINQVIKKVTDDIESSKFNTAIAKLMELTNEFTKLESISKADFEILLRLLNPVAPHICEELWHMLGNDTFINQAAWPTYDKSKLVEQVVQIIVQVNGKLRDKLDMPLNSQKDDVISKAKELEKIIPYIQGKEIRKIIYVPNKIINIVV